MRVLAPVLVRPVALSTVLFVTGPAAHAAAPALTGPLTGSLPLFPASNWWNTDVSHAPVDSAATSKFLSFVGSNQPMHPDLGGDTSPTTNYGIPYCVVDGNQAKEMVDFQYWDQSDGVNHANDQNEPFAFYPIPLEARTQAHWIEGGEPGNQDLRDSADRHILIVDSTQRTLYELYNMFFDGAKWWGGSGAFFDLNGNDRRPDTWTSGDAAGLAILPGLLRYDEMFGSGEIRHALRVTLHDSLGYVYPASHDAGSDPNALPMGARLRLKPTTDISGFEPQVQKVFRAMMRHGLIMADNGTDLYVTGTYDTRWDSAYDANDTVNEVLNSAFGQIHAADFEVVQLGFRGSSPARSRIQDFDRDAAGDLAVYHAASGLWFTRSSTSGGTTTTGFGGPGFDPVAGDYDADGISDLAVYHPASGLWYVKNSATGTTTSLGFGGSAYIPVRADYDRDGKIDIAVFHAQSGLWFIRGSRTNTTTSIGFGGGGGYTPVPADYDGDGKADVAVFHSASGLWFIRNSSDNTTATISYGNGGGYLPVPGDYDGDGKADVAVFRPASGLWFLRNSSTGATTTIGYGAGGGYTPVPADYDGDGRTDPALYHASTGLWFVRPSSGAPSYSMGYGGQGYTPVN